MQEEIEHRNVITQVSSQLSHRFKDFSSTALKNVPEDEINFTPPFDTCFDIIYTWELFRPRKTRACFGCTISQQSFPSRMHQFLTSLLILLTSSIQSGTQWTRIYWEYWTMFALWLTRVSNWAVCWCIVILVFPGMAQSRWHTKEERSEQLSSNKSLSLVKQDRSCVCPNVGFMTQMDEFLTWFCIDVDW